MIWFLIFFRLKWLVLSILCVCLRLRLFFVYLFYGRVRIYLRYVWMMLYLVVVDGSFLSWLSLCLVVLCDFFGRFVKVMSCFCSFLILVCLGLFLLSFCWIVFSCCWRKYLCWFFFIFDCICDWIFELSLNILSL